MNTRFAVAVWDNERGAWGVEQIIEANMAHQAGLQAAATLDSNAAVIRVRRENEERAVYYDLDRTWRILQSRDYEMPRAKK